MTSEILLLTLGFILLIAGGESFVKGASRLAYTFKVSPLVIGLTVVAIGTSAPEFTVAVRAAFSGHMDVSFGDIVGSNIFNVFFILGVSSLVRPIRIPFLSVKNDMLWMLGYIALFILISMDLKIQRVEAAILLILAFVYMLSCLRRGASQCHLHEEVQEEFTGPPAEYRKTRKLLASVGLFLGGGIFLILGARYLVDGAVGIARHWGLSEFFIGLTIVAVGTSLPELMTSVIATLRGKGDIAVGNIIGSNIYNLFLIIGGAASIAPQTVEVPAQILRFDLLFMLLTFFLWFGIIRKYQVLERKSGLLFLGIYGLYLLLQVGLFQK